MPKREGISVKKRFEILSRDRFACQYCGQHAPNVSLVVDHVIPVSQGGEKDDFNLVTACEQCNSGKSATLIHNLEMRQQFRELVDELLKSGRYKELDPEILRFPHGFIENCFYPVRLWCEPGIYRMAGILEDLISAAMGTNFALLERLGFTTDEGDSDSLRLLACLIIDILAMSAPVLIAVSRGIYPPNEIEKFEAITKTWFEEVMEPMSQWRDSRKLDYGKDTPIN